MKAVAVRPGTPDSAHVVEVPDPIARDHEVRVQVLEVGICGTDMEINEGLYGQAPDGGPLLILGHEGLGQLPNGQLVVPMVRRPCPSCSNCRQDAQDMCSTGGFTERGIKGIHGMMSEFITDDPRYLIHVPDRARHYAVLTEPMSVVAKGLRQAQQIQSRLLWEGRRALVLGAGPIGLLATMALRTQGWDVVTMARKPKGTAKAAVVTAVGAKYVSTADVPTSNISECEAPFDFIFEATGSAACAFDALHALAVNGVLCLTSITGGSLTKSIPVDRLNYDVVLGNKLMFGTVNAHRQDFIDGLARMERIEQEYPGVLGRLLTKSVSFSQVHEMFERPEAGIKTVLRVANA